MNHGLAARRPWASLGVALVCSTLAAAGPLHAQPAPSPAQPPSEQPAPAGPAQPPTAEPAPAEPAQPPAAEPAPAEPAQPPAAEPAPATPPQPTDAPPAAATQDSAQPPVTRDTPAAAAEASAASDTHAGEAPATQQEDLGEEGEGWGEEEEVGWGEDGDGGWGDEGDAAGFGDAGAVDPATIAELESIPGELSVGGFLRHMVALWTQRLQEQPLSRARQSADFNLRYKKPFPTSDGRIVMRAVADVHFEYDFAFLADRDLYDEPTLDTYESQVIGGETFLALSLGSLDVAFGRQIVAWGHGEMLSPVDIVNPRDQRDPAISELDDIRMAVLASRVGLFSGAHRLEVMVIHESYFGLRAAPLSDLSPLRGIILDDPSVGMLLQGQELRYDNTPGRFDSKGSQVLGRWTYTGAGIDLALYAASTLDKQGVAVPSFGPQGIALELWHPRYTMLGHAGARPTGDFIFRWELGLDIERPIAVTRSGSTGGANAGMTDMADMADMAGAGPSSDFFVPPLFRNQLNWMLGTSYGGITDGTLSVEYQQSFIVDNPERDDGDLELLVSPELPIFAGRYSHMFLRERLQATVVGMLIGGLDFRGAMGKLDLSYVVADGWKVGAGYATFLPAEDAFGPFYGFDTHDRVYGTLRWDFLLE